MNEDELTIANNEELKSMMEKSGIDKDRYVRGIIFAEYILQGENANDSYCYAFEVSKEEAKRVSSNFRNTKWVQELILYMKPNEETLYFGETRAIIRRLMKIIDNSHDEKEVIAASRALHPYINNRKTGKDKEEEIVQDGKNLIKDLLGAASSLADAGKMLNTKGEVIDVPILK